MNANLKLALANFCCDEQFNFPESVARAHQLLKGEPVLPDANIIDALSKADDVSLDALNDQINKTDLELHGLKMCATESHFENEAKRDWEKNKDHYLRQGLEKDSYVESMVELRRETIGD